MASVSLMQCPCCGKLFPVDSYEISASGNPVCKDCAQQEREEE